MVVSDSSLWKLKIGRSYWKLKKCGQCCFCHLCLGKYPGLEKESHSSWLPIAKIRSGSENFQGIYWKPPSFCWGKFSQKLTLCLLEFHSSEFSQPWDEKIQEQKLQEFPQTRNKNSRDSHKPRQALCWISANEVICSHTPLESPLPFSSAL